MFTPKSDTNEVLRFICTVNPTRRIGTKVYNGYDLRFERPLTFEMGTLLYIYKLLISLLAGHSNRTREEAARPGARLFFSLSSSTQPVTVLNSCRSKIDFDVFRSLGKSRFVRGPVIIPGNPKQSETVVSEDFARTRQRSNLFYSVCLRNALCSFQSRA